jgi:hypothetical protein
MIIISNNIDIKKAVEVYKKVKFYAVEKTNLKIFVKKVPHPTKGQKLDITV